MTIQQYIETDCQVAALHDEVEQVWARLNLCGFLIVSNGHAVPVGLIHDSEG